MPNNHHKLVGVIDEGTSTANFIVSKCNERSIKKTLRIYFLLMYLFLDL